MHFYVPASVISAGNHIALGTAKAAALTSAATLQLPAFMTYLRDSQETGPAIALQNTGGIHAGARPASWSGPVSRVSWISRARQTT